MSKSKDLTNLKYGMLTVLRKADIKDKYNHILWLCECECGNITTATTSALNSNNTRSCGCLHEKVVATHKSSNTRLYNIHRNIIQRCNNSNNKDYIHYGNRGIKVCDEWLNSFETFKIWALNNNYNETLTIERIDVNEDYCPKNCKWIPLKEQRENQRPRFNKKLNLRPNKPIKQLAKEVGINVGTIRSRIRYGWSLEKALQTPVKQ